MKALLIKWLLPIILDTLIDALEDLSKMSTNTIDDRMVESIRSYREDIINEVKLKL